MNADQTLRYLDAQSEAIEALIIQLDEVQVAFNAQYDEFKTQHDGTLSRLTDQVIERLDSVSPELRSAINERVREESRLIEERRQKVESEYFPRRVQAADELLEQAQEELAELRALNPDLDDQEEKLKRQKAELEAQLAELNQAIRRNSRGLGVLLHLMAITRTDRQRHQVLGKLEAINEALHDVRQQWERKRQEVAQRQTQYQDRWQLESIAVARLQSELDQLSDETRKRELALRRAVRHVLDHLKERPTSADPTLKHGLDEMIRLNIQTDNYHGGLASVGGVIGLLRGINSGMDAIRRSINGIRREYEMHSAHLKSPKFHLPAAVEAFHQQWPVLAEQFSDEGTIGAHPAEFSASVQPLLEGPLSQASIEAMFNHLGEMIKGATAAW
jgi:hypothetical protein